MIDKDEKQLRQDEIHSILSRLSDSSFDSSSELPSMGEALKRLAKLSELASTPGLTNLEMRQLQLAINSTKLYIDKLPLFLHVADLERRLNELEEKYSELSKQRKKE